ncbi:hypothetical protein C8Q75DRAFT_808227 [Abortiporus biennis]|nr:hypothetical protein C8Q75DRAFT_808227 [Abortiporus biennis]
MPPKRGSHTSSNNKSGHGWTSQNPSTIAKTRKKRIDAIQNAIISNESQFTVKTALKELLDDRTFFPDGRLLGFGISRNYPIKLKPKTKMSEVETFLEGSDSGVFGACRQLHLSPHARILYQNKAQKDEGVFLSYIPDLDDSNELERGEWLWSALYSEYYSSVWIKAVDSTGVYVVGKNGDDDVNADTRVRTEKMKVFWVTKLTGHTSYKHVHTDGKTDDGVEDPEGKICLITEIGPAGSRTNSMMSGYRAKEWEEWS